MEILNNFIAQLAGLIPTAATIIIVALIVVVVRFTLNKRYAGVSGRQFKRQLATLVLSLVGLLAIILTLPVKAATIAQLLSLLGILLSAAIALSAPTFIGNIMAGLMLRAVRNFRGGDFIRVGDHFGRVSERGLFHIEIQTEDSDLTTLPNLFLVTNPVKVVRSSGTLVTADVSLGYDVPRDKVQNVLVKAGSAAGLSEPFVHILELGDFAVSYRAAGLLTEVKSLLSTRSRLRAMMLDHLHEAGIEIVSPTFMNQRVLEKSRQFMAMPTGSGSSSDSDRESAEAVVFDKAEEAESLERLHERREELVREHEQLKAALADASQPSEKSALEERIKLAASHLERLTAHIESREKEGP